MKVTTKTDIKEFPLLNRGKVRDIYDIDDSTLLIVTTDRMSAFDVIMNEPVPYKGVILNQITLFWMKKFAHLVKNHLIESDVDKFPAALAPYREELEGRSVLVKKAKPLPVECIVRGYITGSGWKDYQATGLKNNSRVKAGSPVYKLIKDNNWTAVILLDDAAAQEMADMKSVKIRFSKDNETAVAGFSIYNTKDANLGFLTFDNSMIRYAEERYLDMELILEDESGLKIPKSSVADKKFYLVPENYLTQGGNSKETGVLINNGKEDAQFKNVEVYYRDKENKMVYLDPNVFDKNTSLREPDGSETYPLKKTKSLKGVYNINKGYAVFKQIHILCESEDYYIVEAGNDYGLANYDHIALDGSEVHENDVVF